MYYIQFFPLALYSILRPWSSCQSIILCDFVCISQYLYRLHVNCIIFYSISNHFYAKIQDQRRKNQPSCHPALFPTLQPSSALTLTTYSFLWLSPKSPRWEVKQAVRLGRGQKSIGNSEKIPPVIANEGVGARNLIRGDQAAGIHK